MQVVFKEFSKKQSNREVNKLLLTNYDFYDIYSILVAIRFKPQNECNAEIIQSVINIISAPQSGNDVDSNIVRKKIREIYNLDRDLFKFAFVDNIYTYGIRSIKGFFSCFREKLYKNGEMRRFKFAGHKVYHGGNSSNILKSFFCGAVSNRPWSTLAHKSVNFGFVCQAGAVSRRKMDAEHRLDLSF